MYKVPTFSCFIQINGILLKWLPWVHTTASSWQEGFSLCLPTLSSICHERAKNTLEPTLTDKGQIRSESPLNLKSLPSLAWTPVPSVIWPSISLLEKTTIKTPFRIVLITRFRNALYHWAAHCCIFKSSPENTSVPVHLQKISQMQAGTVGWTGRKPPSYERLCNPPWW